MDSATRTEMRDQLIKLDQRVRSLVESIQKIGDTQNISSPARSAPASSPPLSTPQRSHFQLVLPSSTAPSSEQSVILNTSLPSQHPTNPQSSATSIPTAPNNSSVPVHSLPCRPWNRDDFFQRLETYRVLTFFAHSAQLSPLQFARYGWVNNTIDCVECTFCRKQLSLKNANTIPFFHSKINEAHATWCLWRSNPCPLAFITINFHTKATALQEFDRRHQSYSLLDVLPNIHPHNEIEQSLFEPCFKTLSDHQIVSDDEREKVITGLVLLGWELSQKKKTSSGQSSICLSCSFCQRKLVVSSLQRSQSDQSLDPFPNAKRARVDANSQSIKAYESVSTSGFAHLSTPNHTVSVDSMPSYFIKQHRWYCPWVSQEIKPLGLPSSLRSKTEADSSPGYIRFIQAINQTSNEVDVPLADKIAALQKLVFGVPLVSRRITPKALSNQA